MRRFSIYVLWSLPFFIMILLVLSWQRVGFTGQLADDGIFMVAYGQAPPAHDRAFVRPLDSELALYVWSANFKRDRTPLILHSIAVLAKDGRLIKRKAVRARLVNVSGMITVDHIESTLGLNGGDAARHARKTRTRGSTEALKIIFETRPSIEFNVMDIKQGSTPGDTVEFTLVATYYNMLTKIEKTEDFTLTIRAPRSDGAQP